MAGPQYEEDNPSEPPPSYSEAILLPPPPMPGTHEPPRHEPPRHEPPRQNGYAPPQAPPRQQAPPQAPQRPQAPPNHPQGPPAPTASSSLYTANSSLPFQYPQRHFCKKCKNSGFRGRDCCRDCWNKFYLKDNAYNPNPSLPFKYPRRYFCDKCHNSGNKLKNGLLCQDCWSVYGPRNRAQPMQAQPSFDPFFGGGMHTNTYVGAAPRPMFPGNAPQFGFGGPVQYGAAPAPLRVRPGDPRIGGVLCGRCRGSGLVRDFLDEETCHVCRGLGRIIHT